MIKDYKVNGQVDTLTRVISILKEFPAGRLDPIYRGMIEMHLRSAAYELNEVVMYLELESKSLVPRKSVCL